MAEVRFYGRYALKNIQNPDLDLIEKIFLKELPVGGEWGEVSIEYWENDRVATVIVLADKVHGYYIKYISSEEDEFMSLGDRDRLTTNICPDDWEAALGLFLPRETAYKVILDFIDSGSRSDAIAWIQEQDMPKEAKWSIIKKLLRETSTML